MTVLQVNLSNMSMGAERFYPGLFQEEKPKPAGFIHSYIKPRTQRTEKVKVLEHLPLLSSQDTPNSVPLAR